MIYVYLLIGAAIGVLACKAPALAGLYVEWRAARKLAVAHREIMAGRLTVNDWRRQEAATEARIERGDR